MIRLLPTKFGEDWSQNKVWPSRTPFLPLFTPFLTPLGVTFPNSDFKSFHVEQKAVSGANFIKIAQWEHKKLLLLDLTPFWPYFDPFQLPLLTPFGVTFPKSDFKSFHVEQKAVSGANFIKIAQWEHKNYQLLDLTPFWPHFDPFQLTFLTPLRVTFPNSDFKSFHVEQKSMSGVNFMKIAQWEHKNYQWLEWPHFDPILTTYDPHFDPLRGHFSKIRLRILSCWAKISVWCEFHKDSSMGTQKLPIGAVLEIQKWVPFTS